MKTVHYTTSGSSSATPGAKKTKVLRIVDYPSVQYPTPIDTKDVSLPTLEPNHEGLYEFDETWNNTDRPFRDSLLQLYLGERREKRKAPKLGGTPLNMYALYTLVCKMGGYTHCCNRSGAWSTVHYHLPNYSPTSTSASSFLKSVYEKFLLSYEHYFANVRSRANMGTAATGINMIGAPIGIVPYGPPPNHSPLYPMPSETNKKEEEDSAMEVNAVVVKQNHITRFT